MNRSQTRRLAVAAVTMILAAQIAAAQGGATWQSVANGPAARFDTRLAYDPGTGKVVLFGGQVALVFPPAIVPGQDTWEWDGAWTQRTPAHSPPAGSSKLLYHEALGGVIALQSGGAWLWDGSDWSNVGGPPPITGDYAYDKARQRVVLVGAQQTWEWDTFSWTLRTTGGAWGGRMCYDEARGVVVLLQPEAWEWDGVSWTRRPAAVEPFTVPPAPLALAQLSQPVFDPDRRRVIVHGTWADSFSGNFLSSEVWEWDGVAWSQLGAGPYRWGMMMAYHEAGHQTLVLGGSTNAMSGAYPSAQGLTLSSLTPAAFAAYGSGCPGSAGPLSLTAAPFSRPWAGDTFTVELDGLPPGCLPWLMLGFSSAATAPLPGCTRWTSADAVVTLVPTGGRVAHTLAIPTGLGTALVGTSLYYQGAALLAGGNNALGLAASPGGRAILGVR